MSERMTMEQYLAKWSAREQNAADLQRAWKKFIREQDKKNGRDRENHKNN